ncbi:MAG TPA: hypothetical protein VG520_00270 [Candidatus Dormibacteraeota bacterium]|nr:hypothetical protein [Candidatus Dormibacteraeota bacterium]
MYLIEACPVPTPADAERLVADLWQLTAGRGLGLFVFGVGDRVMLGVSATHSGIEATAASMIADQCGSAVEAGWMVGEMIDAASEVAAVNLVPTNRHIAVESRTFGWQRTDPLRGTFLALVSAPPGALAGVALSLRALPDLGFALSLGVFAAGPAAAARVAGVASTLGGVGVRLRRPLLQRRAARRMAQGALRRPASVRRVEVVALFWHPPFGSDAGLRTTATSDDAPAGYLAPGRNA